MTDTSAWFLIYIVEARLKCVEHLCIVLAFHVSSIIMVQYCPEVATIKPVQNVWWDVPAFLEFSQTFIIYWLKLIICVLKEYKERKRQRVQKKISDQLKQAAKLVESQKSATQDLQSLLGAIGDRASSNTAKTKGSRFTHAEELQFAQVRLSKGWSFLYISLISQFTSVVR